MTVNVVTTPAAVAAVFTPWWLPVLQDVSAGAALALPILGVLWLVIQIIVKAYAVYRHGAK